MDPVRGASDATLVTAAKAGDDHAFAVLFERWVDRVFDVAWRVLRDPDEAIEVTQETFLAAWRNLEWLENPAAFGGWLLRTSRNKSLNRHDHHPVGSDLPDPTRPAADLDPSGLDPNGLDDLRRATAGDVAWAATAALGPRDASLLNLHLRHGFDAPAIADTLGVTTNNAHQLLYRLKEKLSRAVRAWTVWDGGDPGCARLRTSLTTAGVTGFSAEAVAVTDRHAQRCEVCGEAQRGLLHPQQLFAAVPVLALPALSRATLVARLDRFGVPAAGGDRPWDPDAPLPPSPTGVEEEPGSDEPAGGSAGTVGTAGTAGTPDDSGAAGADAPSAAPPVATVAGVPLVGEATGILDLDDLPWSNPDVPAERSVPVAPMAQPRPLWPDDDLPSPIGTAVAAGAVAAAGEAGAAAWTDTGTDTDPAAVGAAAATAGAAPPPRRRGRRIAVAAALVLLAAVGFLVARGLTDDSRDLDVAASTSTSTTQQRSSGVLTPSTVPSSTEPAAPPETTDPTSTTEAGPTSTTTSTPTSGLPAPVPPPETAPPTAPPTSPPPPVTRPTSTTTTAPAPSGELLVTPGRWNPEASCQAVMLTATTVNAVGANITGPGITSPISVDVKRPSSSHQVSCVSEPSTFTLTVVGTGGRQSVHTASFTPEPPATDD